MSWIKCSIREDLTKHLTCPRSFEPPYIDLVFGSQMLEDTRNLRSYGIHSGSELTLVVRSE